MYTKEYFDNYPVFKNIIKKYGIQNFLDPLTQTISRGYIMSYVEDLIKENKSFYMIIMDIDNFKQINDNYGHKVGDEVLAMTAKNIVETIGRDGLVGRYGGDEFIIIDYVHKDYDSIHKFLEEMYMNECNGVFRRIMNVGQVKLFITGTVGCANFPNDSTDFDDLFLKADKALYRGKIKGRNCFIIYVHEKHKDIDISKLIKEPIQTTVNTLFKIFDENKPLYHKQQEAYNHIKKVLKISDVLFVNSNNELEGDKNYFVKDLDIDLDENVVAVYTATSDIINPNLKKFVEDKNIASMMIGRLTYKGNYYGHIVFGENNTLRIWQNEDIALLLLVIRLIGSTIYLENK